MKNKVSMQLANWLGILCIAMLSCSVSAQGLYSQQKLDQLLAPIALYPDPLLGQVLIAATYPLEVVQAASFLKRSPQLNGNALAEAGQNQGWDTSIQSLLPFPSVLLMMDQQLPWTQQVGDAFLSQEQAVMDTVQNLRHRAWQNGSLRSNQQQVVNVQADAITIDPYTQNVIAVPYYDPMIVYGNWWRPDSRPMIWVPPMIYRTSMYGSEIGSGIAFGIGIGIIGSLFLDTRPDWRGHHMMIFQGGHNRSGGIGAVWHHDPSHRQGVAYRSSETRNRFFSPVNQPVNREAYRGRVESASQTTQYNNPTHQSRSGVLPILGKPAIAGKFSRPDNLQPEHVPQIRSQPVQSNSVMPAQIPGRQNHNVDLTPRHPLMPAGSSAQMQSHAARGQQSMRHSNAMPNNNHPVQARPSGRK